MLSRNLEQTLHRSLSLASERRHAYATLEHLLLGLVDDTDAASVLRGCGVDLNKLRSDLSEFLDRDLARLTTDRPGDPKPTAGFQRVVQRAAIHVQSSGRDEVTGANVLIALFSERESHAVYFLQLHDMTRLDAMNFISHGITKSPGRSTQRPVIRDVEDDPSDVVTLEVIAGQQAKILKELSDLRAEQAALHAIAKRMDAIMNELLGEVRALRSGGRFD